MYKKYTVIDFYKNIDPNDIGKWYIVEYRDNPIDDTEITGLDRFYVVGGGYMLNVDRCNNEDTFETFYMKEVNGMWTYGNEPRSYANQTKFKQEMKDFLKVRDSDLYKAVYNV